MGKKEILGSFKKLKDGDVEGFTTDIQAELDSRLEDNPIMKGLTKDLDLEDIITKKVVDDFEGSKDKED